MRNAANLNLRSWKSRVRRALAVAGISEGTLSRVAILLHPDRWPQQQDIRRDYEELRSHLGGGLPPVVPKQGAPRTLIISMWDEFYFLKVDVVLARALMAAGHDVTVLHSERAVAVEPYFQLFGLRKFVTLESFVRSTRSRPLVGEAECSGIRAPFSFGQLMDFKVAEFHLGVHILSSLLASFRIGHLDLESAVCGTFVRDTLDDLPALMAAVRSLFDDLRPDNLLLQERGFLPNALFWDEALFRKVNLAQWTQAQETDALVLKKYEPGSRKQHPLSLSAASWNSFKETVWTESLDRELMEMFRGRYEKDDWYNRNLYRAKSPIVSSEAARRELKLDAGRKTAAVFSHILWDATFFFGENLFRDYEEWLLETTKCACANPNLNWIIKLHPDYVWKLARAGGAKLDEPEILRRQFGDLPGHVQLMLPDCPINTYSLFQIADYCVTVRGTAGIEMSCFGKPTVTGGTGRYSGIGFTLDPRSSAEYRQQLASLHEVPPMSREQTMLARKFAYALYRLRPFRHSSFRSSVRKSLDSKHPLFINFSYGFKTAGEFGAATDMQNFAQWFSDPAALDYVSPWPEGRDVSAAATLLLPWTLPNT
jgi:hypothetical protein